MSFVQRLINVQISLANGQFGGGGNSATLTGLRCSIRTSSSGGSSNPVLEGAIWGMTLSQMNQLSTVGTQLGKKGQDTIAVMAGDAQSGMALVYKGTLMTAFVDAQAMPQVVFRVSGQSGAYEAVKPIPATSVKGSGDVAMIAQGLAKQMGLTFENSGVTTKIANPYLSGSGRMQMLTLAQHAGIEHIIEKGKLAIWDPSKGRQGSTIMISPETGMIGYPMFNQQSIVVRTVFDPTIEYGGTMQVKSDLTPACGKWNINMVDLDLDSMTPHGKWEARLTGVPATASEISP